MRLRIPVGLCSMGLLVVTVAACGGKKESQAPSAPAAQAASATAATAPPVATPGPASFEPAVEALGGLRPGVAVLTTPEGASSPVRTAMKGFSIPCGRPTPTDPRPTKRRFETVLQVDAPAAVTFLLMTDDDGVLSINGTEVKRTSSLAEAKVRVRFAKAGGYRLTLDVDNNVGPYCADVLMSVGEDPFLPLPEAKLFQPPG